MLEKQERSWNCLIEQTGEQVAKLLTDYHGMQLLTDEFYEYLIEEGYLPEED